MKCCAVPICEAFYEAMCQRGTAAVFTAVTMSIGVCTWAFAPLKFQADMGVLLSFMFLVNVLGAIFLLPALAAWFNRGRPLVGDRIRTPAPAQGQFRLKNSPAARDIGSEK